MKDYKQLAVRYLKHNKKRTLLTILGVALSTMILFAFLNAMLSLYFTKRDELGETVKYEAILLCKEESIKEQIIEEPFVVETKETTIELSPDEGGGHVAALYTRFDRPYQTGRYLRQLEEKYGIRYRNVRTSESRTIHLEQIPQEPADNDNTEVILPVA